MSFLNKNNIFVDDGKSIYDFIEEIDVRCPGCRNKATVTRKDGKKARFTCIHCGAAKEWDGCYSVWQISKTVQADKNHLDAILIGAPCDPFFKYDLYYTRDYKGKPFWVYNKRHLDYIESFLLASAIKKVENQYGRNNASLASRLPGFIKNKKNRRDLLMILNRWKQETE